MRISGSPKAEDGGPENGHSNTGRLRDPYHCEAGTGKGENGGRKPKNRKEEPKTEREKSTTQKRGGENQNGGHFEASGIRSSALKVSRF